MSAAPQAKCVTCSQTAPLRPDGRFKRHPKRPTRGTEHTAGLARAAGLTVDAQTWGSR